jgi:hypothetical protein
MALPSRSELENEHLFRQLDLEKIFGRAFHALIAGLARDVCFRDTSRQSAFVISEAHAVTVSFEGERHLAEFVRDGRKHRANALIDSHDPEADLGSATLRGLIPTRIVMRHRDKELAARSLRWLGLDPTDEDLLDLITKHTSPLVGDKVPVHRRGEALMRDMSGNVGRVKVLLPSRRSRADAIHRAGSAAARRSGDAA